MTKQRPVISTYDDIADVLYFGVEFPSTGVRYRDDESGVLLRVKSNGEAVGVTVEDFHYAWLNRLDSLAAVVSSRLGVNQADVRSVLTEL